MQLMRDCDMYLCLSTLMILLFQFPNFIVICYFICLMFCMCADMLDVWNTVITQDLFTVGLYGQWMKLWSKTVSWENEGMITHSPILQTIVVVMQIFRKMYVCFIFNSGICYYLNLLFCLCLCVFQHLIKQLFISCF